MVARAERAALVAAAFHRPMADVVGLGAVEAAAGLGVFDVAGGRQPRVARVPGPFGQQPPQFLAAEQVRPAAAHAGGNRRNSASISGFNRGWTSLVEGWCAPAARRS